MAGLEKKQITSADYHLEMLPANNKTWREADDINVALTLKIDNEERTFKGVTTLFGIVKK